ncbi:MAG TPA: SgcJ/EcaC family oxidoreductase, partial [Gammaproteobacteria bacterium]|nr:SgcJ/EcaC family oxidoreductase [Gammaproteobacteria bacterium]
NGRAQIREELAKIFHNHKVSTYVGIVKEIRKIADNLYLLRSVAGMLPPGKTEIKPDVNAIQTLIIANTPNKFKIELYQNTPAAFHGRPELSKNLTDELQRAADRHLTMS